MFNTPKFIMEVQKRPCLWNIKDSTHGDRQLKSRAWDEIAKVLNTTADSYSLNSKNITIDELQRKWKHLRDYYIREKKRTSKADSNSESNISDRGNPNRKRKSPLLHMLKFLDVNRGSDIMEVIIERNVDEENFYPETAEEEVTSVSDYELETCRPSKILRIEASQSHLNPLSDDNENSADRQFLASLLPIIKKMSIKERFRFRADLLKPTYPQEYTHVHIDKDDKSRTTETRKRHKIARELEEMDVVNKETRSSDEAPKRDEFSIYGEYVANKLRNIQNKHARHTAEYHINGILYKAEMGEYDIVPKVPTNTTKPSTSRESSNFKLSTVMYEEDDSDDIIANVIKTEDVSFK